MKPLKEEKFDLIPVRVPLKLLLCFSILFPLQAQVNINNFCYYNNLSTSPNSNKIIVYDYSQDGFPDIVLLNGVKKDVVEISGKNNLSVAEQREKFFFYPINDLKKLNHKATDRDIFIFISRKERICGLLSFTKFGTLQLLHQTSFDNYPEKIITGDIDNDSNNEAIVFGSNFEGLMLLREKDFVLRRKSIAKERVFSEAQFVDLDYDGFLDIVAFDLFAGAITFFYNDQEGNFFEYRQLETTGVVKNLKVHDFNRDGYSDLLFQTENSLNIFKGDSVSSFTETKNIEFDEKLVDYALSDFNNDGLNDLAIIDEANFLKISFASTPDSLLASIVYFKKDGLTDLEVYNRGKKKCLLVLSDTGELYSISNFIMNKSKIQISLGIKPTVVSSFRYSDSYHMDLCFIDSEDGKLKIILRGNSGVFLKYLEIPINYNYSKILIPKNQKPLTTFFFYTPGEKLIERVKVDLSLASFKKEKYYSYKSISELKIEEEGDSQTAFALLFENGVAELKKFFFDSESTIIEKTETLNKNVIAPSLAMGSIKKLYYWAENGAFYEFREQDLEGGSQFKVIYESKNKTSFSQKFSTYSYSQNNIKRELPIGEMILGDNYFVYFYDNNKLNRIKSSRKNVTNLNENDLAYYRTLQGKYRYIFSYDKAAGKLYYSDVSNSGENISLSGLFENIYINNYFVTELFLNEISIVYSDPIENCITIRKIE